MTQNSDTSAVTPLKRDSNGLLEGVAYRFTPDGRVDWRALVDKKYLYIAKEYEERVVKEQGKPLSEVDITLVRDDWLRIRLGGINQLANLRGYTSLKYHSFVSAESHAAIICEMTFIPNYETGFQPLVCSGVASARRASMDKQMIGYLEAFAENRAFTRCVKRALQINILSDIEVGGDGRDVVEDDKVSDATTTSGFNPYNTLAELCQQKGVSFERLKEGAKQYQADLKSKVDEWVGFESIQPIDAWLLIGKIKEKEAKKEGKGKKS